MGVVVEESEELVLEFGKFGSIGEAFVKGKLMVHQVNAFRLE